MVLCLISPSYRGCVLLPPSENILQRFVQVRVCLILNPVGDAIGCFGDTAGNGRQGVAVTSKGDGIAYGILKVRAFQECNDSLGHSILAGFMKPIAGSNFVQGLGEIITVFPLDMLPNATFTL